MYDTDGLFVGSFGLKEACDITSDITATNDGRVMVVKRDDSSVHIFSEDGDYLDKFKLQGSYFSPTIAFHQLSEHVVIAGKKEESVVVVEIFTKDGEFVRSTQIHEKRALRIRGMTVTLGGRIAVLQEDIDDEYVKVLVI